MARRRFCRGAAAWMRQRLPQATVEADPAPCLVFVDAKRVLSLQWGQLRLRKEAGWETFEGLAGVELEEIEAFAAEWRE